MDVDFDLQGRPDHAGFIYMIVGGASGTAPGAVVPGEAPYHPLMVALAGALTAADAAAAFDGEAASAA